MNRSPDSIHFRMIQGKQLAESDPLIEEILNLQSELIVGPDSQSSSNGFLISRFTQSELFSLLQNDGILFLAKDVQECLIAYALIVPIEEFRSLYSKPEEGVFRSLESSLKATEIKPSFKYLYQVALRKSSSRKGIGSRFLKNILSSMYGPLLTDVLTAPIDNKASCNFFLKNGFQEIGILTLAQYRDFGSLVSKVFLWQP